MSAGASHDLRRAQPHGIDGFAVSKHRCTAVRFCANGTASVPGRFIARSWSAASAERFGNFQRPHVQHEVSGEPKEVPSVHSEPGVALPCAQ